MSPASRSLLQLVIVHYHLNRGGVTSVIRSHLQSLAQVADELSIDQVSLAYGGRAANWSWDFERNLPFPVSELVIPGLEYDQLQTGDGKLFEQLRLALAGRNCVPEATILHVHNHGLGKNAKLPAALAQLANDRWRLFLQMHDFAEDLRPANYAHLLSQHDSPTQLWETLYPQAPQIHYATLNQIDCARLKEAGIDATRLHLVPNPVVMASPDSAKNRASSKTALARTAARRKLRDAYSVAEEAPYVLYPVRGIRRKNLGELVLWSMLLEGCVFSVTLEPKNERERLAYLSWRGLSESLSLPIIFGSGEKLSLDDNYAAADAIVSTSVAEGFGLVFLEAALRHRPLFGRNLPGVTADFREDGMRFPGLAAALQVPVSAFNAVALRSSYQRRSERLRSRYGLPKLDHDELHGILDDLLRDECFDFGRLDLDQQRVVISKLSQDERLKVEICSLNPCVELVRQTLLGENSDLVAAAVENCAAIEEHYSLQSTGSKLASVYQDLLSGDPGPVKKRPDIGRYLLTEFSRPENLFPVRLES